MRVLASRKRGSDSVTETARTSVVISKYDRSITVRPFRTDHPPVATVPMCFRLQSSRLPGLLRECGLLQRRGLKLE